MSAKRIVATVCSQERLAEGIYSLWLSCGDVAAEAKAGQFVSLFCKDSTRRLGRPLSICEIDREQKRLRIVYRVAGKGTAEFSHLRPADEITVMGPLGNGYDRPEGNVIVVGGGIGVPPMLELAKEVKGNVTAVLGYRDSNLFLKEDLEKYARVVIATEDGSVGTKGTVIDAMKAQGVKGDILCACGPTPMLKALQKFTDEQGMEAWFSLEERMACGIGICLGCAVAVKTEDGYTYKRVCKDGPVFNSKEIIFK